MGTLVPIRSPSARSWALTAANDWMRHKIAANAIRNFREGAKEKALAPRLAILMLLLLRWSARLWLTLSISTTSSSVRPATTYQQKFTDTSLFIHSRFFLCNCSALLLLIHFPPLRRDYNFLNLTNITHRHTEDEESIFLLIITRKALNELEAGDDDDEH